MSGALEAALDMAARGFRVFPLQPGSKLPAVRWTKEATMGVEKIGRWFADNPNINFGVATGNGVAVIDVDVKEGRDGLASLDYLQDAHGLPDTFTVRTPSGGLHVYAACNEALRNAVDHLPGIDIRSAGAYVVAPGSAIGGKFYEIEQDRPLAPLPAALAAMWKRPDRPKTNTHAPLVELDQSHNIDRYRDYLVNRAPEALEGVNGNANTCETMWTGHDYGLSETVTLDLMLECWNKDKALPPWSPDELSELVEARFHAAQGSWGGRAAELDRIASGADFDVVDIGDDTPANDNSEPGKAGWRERWRAVDYSEDYDYEPEPELIRDTVPQTGTGFIGGQSGAFKTFVAIDLAFSIATGESFAGRVVEHPGAVLLFAAEGVGSIRGRIKARRQKLTNSKQRLPICVVEATDKAGDLQTAADFKAFGAMLRETLAEMETEFGVPPGAVFVDTVMAAGMIAEDKENDPVAWQRPVRWLNSISRKIGVPILLVHHFGKDQSAGLRGSSGARGAADFVIAATCDRDERTGETKNHRLALTKHRDAPEGPIADIVAKVVEIGKRQDGSVKTSLTLEFVPPGKKVNAVSSLDSTDRERARCAAIGKRTSEKSDQWAGYAVADELAFDIGQGERAGDWSLQQRNDRKFVRSLLRSWVQDGGLFAVERKDSNRDTREFYDGPETVIIDEGDQV